MQEELSTNKFVDRIQRVLNPTFQRSINNTLFEVIAYVIIKQKEDKTLKS